LSDRPSPFIAERSKEAAMNNLLAPTKPNPIRSRRPLTPSPIRKMRPSQSQTSGQAKFRESRFTFPKVTMQISSGILPVIASNILVMVAIALAGFVTFLLQRGQDHALTLIWPAGGIALAAVILRGPWVAPGILIPLWISCLMGGEGLLFSLMAPLGTTVAVVAGASVLHRIGWNRKLSSSRDVLLLLGIGGLLPMMAAGFWTAILLIIAKTMPSAAFLQVGWLYGCANTAGTIVLAPVILMVAEGRFRWGSSSGIYASILPVSSCLIAAWIAFGIQPSGPSNKTLAVLAYLPFPFLVWTALTRGLPAAASAILGVIGIAVAFTSRGVGPFASVSMLSGLWQYEIYIAILTSTGLLLGVGAEALKRETTLREEALVREAELERLKAQIHPHFLFNSLNAIHSLIGSDPGGARGGILSLSRLLRTSLDTAKESRISFGKELEIIRSYLELQKMRFEEALETEIRVQGSAADFPVAPMTIQPLVENAVKHGIIEGTNTISITATTTGDWLAVTITNLAEPGTDPSTWKESVGLSAIRARLREAWGDRAELSFASTPSGMVTTSLKIPRG
jgi:signal transduction histidine kinase